MAAKARSDSEKFIHQTTVDRIVEIALDAVDKPDIFTSDPANAIRFWADRDRSLVEEALARCRKTAAENPRDFVAAGATQILSSVLDASV